MGSAGGSSKRDGGDGASSVCETRDTSALELLSRTATSAGHRAEKRSLARGTRVARYVILEPLGEGGMGVVYKAYDPELDRGVALKLLTVAETDSNEAARARARLLREAQALAQLSHPNVVAIHDAGMFEGNVFIAMELVEGSPLGRWLRSEQRTRAQIVEAFLAAGRGLAAAHAKGLIHRDFKPSNVLVGEDGRVRVADFGLARAEEMTDGGSATLDGQVAAAEGEAGAGPVPARDECTLQEEEISERADRSSERDEATVQDDAGLASADRAWTRAAVGANRGAADHCADLPSAGDVRWTGSTDGGADAMCAPSTDTATGGGSSRCDVHTPLTATGAVLGTPQYMSPEQFMAAQLDFRTDQFSFCVALWEALYGRRPFHGRSLPTVVANVLSGEIQPPPSGTRVPARLRRLLYRGLSVSPADRYPSMNALLAELSRSLRSVRRRAAAAVAVAVAVCLLVTAAWGMQRSQASPPLCQGAQGELAGRWDDRAREAMLRGFVATQLPYAEDAHRRVARAVDSYASDWVALRTSSCEATHLRGIQSPQLLDRRMLCLDQRLGLLTALVEQLSTEVGPETVEKALPAVLALPDLAICADDEQLLAAVPPPSDPAVRAQVAHAREAFARARALEATARGVEALELTQSLEGAVATIEYPPLHAEYQLLLAHLNLAASDAAAAETAARKAIRHAARAKDDDRSARSWALLMRSLSEQAEYDRALALRIGAEAAIARGASELQRSAELEECLALIYISRAEYRDATAHAQRALELSESAYGDNHPAVAQALYTFGYAHSEGGDKEQAGRYYERALEIRRAVFGPSHPLTAELVQALGVLAFRQQKVPEAEQAFEQAIALFEDVYGQDHPKIAVARRNLGVVYLQRGKYEQGVELLALSLPVVERHFGAKHPDVAKTLINLGAGYAELEQFKRAVDYYDRAQVVLEAYAGPAHRSSAFNLVRTGMALTGAGDYARAEELFTRSAELLTAELGEAHGAIGVYKVEYGRLLYLRGEHLRAQRLIAEGIAVLPEGIDLVRPLRFLGEVELALGRPAAALAPLERALSLYRALDYEVVYALPHVEFALARALWALGEQTRALEHAGSARLAFMVDVRPSAMEGQRAVNRWLREREPAGTTRSVAAAE